MTEYYDLSPPLGPLTPAWPSDPAVIFEPYKAQVEGETSNVTRLIMGTHSGSHIDAPRHFYQEGAAVDKLPLDVLIGEAWIVEVGGRVIDKRALEKAIAGKDVKRLLLKTANSSLWTKPEFSSEFVALSADAAEYIVDSKVALVGIDYLSIEAAHGTGTPVHELLLGRGIVVVEGLNLSEAPAGRYELFCLPLRLAGLDGAPARVVVRSIDS